ncbi:MAG TPA: beta-phosphoglucomutase family hydrolase [bacterium]|nr:beta-phosphoglucomutase family hydrolase [bacterium]
MFKGAIFDLDGVIVDTVPIHFKAWKKMFSEYGIDFTFDEYKSKVDGIPRYDGARAILTDISEAELKEAGDRKQRYFLEFIEKEEIPVYASSIDLVKELKSHNKKIAFASSSRNCKRILQRAGIIYLADAIVDGNDITRAKPDPQIFQLAAGRLGCAYVECVVFEDAVLGIEAAVNGKMLCIGIDRYGNAKRLTKANLVVEDLSKVDYETIEGLFKK